MIKDSGDRTQFKSGAVRDMHEGKGRCDLLPLDVVAKLYENVIGSTAIFSGLLNFQETGEWPRLFTVLAAFLDHHIPSDVSASQTEITTTALLEVAKHFEEGAKKYGDNNWRKGIPANVYIDSAIRHYLKFLRGDKDEPHDRAFMWNIMCCIWTCKNIPELNTYAKDEEAEQNG